MNKETAAMDNLINPDTKDEELIDDDTKLSADEDKKNNKNNKNGGDWDSDIEEEEDF